MAVNAVNTINLVSSSLTEAAKAPKGENIVSSFGEYLKNALDNVSNLELDAQKIAEDFAAGRTDNIHQVMIAAEKADVALQFTMQIRNKILDAYNEIMRMQI